MGAFHTKTAASMSQIISKGFEIGVEVAVVVAFSHVFFQVHFWYTIKYCDAFKIVGLFLWEGIVNFLYPSSHFILHSTDSLCSAF